MTINGRPIGLNDTIARTANTVLAGPTSGGAAAPTFRLLVTSDMPKYIMASEVMNSTSISL